MNPIYNLPCKCRAAQPVEDAQGRRLLVGNGQTYRLAQLDLRFKLLLTQAVPAGPASLRIQSGWALVA